MNLKTYLARKKGQDKSDRFREVCGRCFRPRKTCLCATIQPFDTETHFVILMHPKEAKKIRMGTGRLTHLFLNNSEIRVGVDFSEDERVDTLISDSRHVSFVLYPGENSVDISERDSLFYKISDKKRLVFVIDASWPLAKKMLKESPNLGVLPQIHFRPKESSRFFKKQPHDFCLCTIESVSLLLEEMQKKGIENCRGNNRRMLDTLDKMHRIQSSYKSDLSLSRYGSRDLSHPPKKWAPGKRQRRSVCFDDKNTGE
ncbi:MAG: DTW domain-containing protein [Candidatus Aminicenantes bacterium]|nr:DTW domain-containing protein [Candidatus Aminicenantes bacterium]